MCQEMLLFYTLFLHIHRLLLSYTAPTNTHFHVLGKVGRASRLPHHSERIKPLNVAPQRPETSKARLHSHLLKRTCNWDGQQRRWWGKKDKMEGATEWSANITLTNVSNEVRHAPELVQSVQNSEYLHQWRINQPLSATYTWFIYWLLVLLVLASGC